MVVSMTGFGRSEIKEDGVEASVEVRTLNHRFMDIALRLPKVLSAYEGEVKELVRNHLSRGRVEVAINLKSDDAAVSGLTIDQALANTYVELLKRLKEQFGLHGPIGLEHLLNFPDIITVETEEQPNEQVWGTVRQALVSALDDLSEMRRREGEEIKRDLVGRVRSMDAIIKKIESKSRSRAREEFARLRQKLQELIGTGDADEGRLEMEIALLADRVDVTEECIRFKSHSRYFVELMESEEAAGRKLNFLLQEMHREANTIGAKANDAQISHWVVEAKEEVEKLREQVQNVE